eukprot:Rmarinus@m.18136
MTIPESLLAQKNRDQALEWARQRRKRIEESEMMREERKLRERMQNQLEERERMEREETRMRGPTAFFVDVRDPQSELAPKPKDHGSDNERERERLRDRDRPERDRVNQLRGPQDSRYPPASHNPKRPQRDQSGLHGDRHEPRTYQDKPSRHSQAHSSRQTAAAAGSVEESGYEPSIFSLKPGGDNAARRRRRWSTPAPLQLHQEGSTSRPSSNSSSTHTGSGAPGHAGRNTGAEVLGRRPGRAPLDNGLPHSESRHATHDENHHPNAQRGKPAPQDFDGGRGGLPAGRLGERRYRQDTADEVACGQRDRMALAQQHPAPPPQAPARLRGAPDSSRHGGADARPFSQPPSQGRLASGTKATRDNGADAERERRRGPFDDVLGERDRRERRKSVPEKASGGETLKRIRNIERRREARRMHSEQKHRLKQKFNNSPNWEFQAMIEDTKDALRSCARRNLKLDGYAEQDTSSRICVCIRKRPLSLKERQSKDTFDVVSCVDGDVAIVHEPKVGVDLTKKIQNHKFAFDRVFGEDVLNDEVYANTVRDLLEVLLSRSGRITCFAYGQTGSGKTFTMRSIYSSAVRDLFHMLSADLPSVPQLDVTVAFFEIYCEQVYDLLNARNRLRVLEDHAQNMQVVGLREVDATSPSDVERLIAKGESARSTNSTEMNADSSRSHAILQISLRDANSGELFSKLSLIDLAGNERASDTPNSNQVTRMEGAGINQSLLALKECIRALDMDSLHTPFRSSMLTRILRDSFINTLSRTIMIATVSPTSSCCDHSLNTLRYADRLKEIGSRQ